MAPETGANGAVEGKLVAAPNNCFDGPPNGRGPEDEGSRIEDCDEEPKPPAEPENKLAAKK